MHSRNMVHANDEKDETSFISDDLYDRPHVDINVRTLKLNFAQSGKLHNSFSKKKRIALIH